MLGAADFARTWDVRRVITDRFSDQVVKFNGQAVMSVRGDGDLDYQEDGTMTLGAGPAMTATRRYLWRVGTRRVDVMFADGAPFHTFVPSGQSRGTDHPCGDDFYTVAYDFAGWPDWTATWDVTGPRKDYRSVSHYSIAR